MAKGKSDQKASKGAKPKDRRPVRLRKVTYGMVKRTRSRKGPGNRRQSQKRTARLL